MHDTRIPFNHLPKLPVNFDFTTKEILAALGNAKESLAELKGISYLFDSKISHMLLYPLTTAEAVSSSNIENIHSTIEGSFQAEVLSSAEVNLPDKETKDYKWALLHAITELNNSSLIFTTEIIERIQKEIIKESNNLVPGYRKIRVNPETGIELTLRIVDRSSNEVIYTPPHGDELVAELMEDLVLYCNEDKGVDALIKIAIIHYQFEAIHPFEDGNGRVGRILFVLSLLSHKKLDIPVLYISQYLLRNKSEYYRLIKEVTFNNNWEEYIIFVLKGIEVQARITKKVFENIKQFIGETDEILISNKLKIKSDCFIERPYYTISQLTEKSGLSRQTITKYLEQLVKINFLQEFKIGNERVFYSSNFLNILSARQ